MTEQQAASTTTYRIEHYRAVSLADPEHDFTTGVMAWVPAGEIELDEAHGYWRDALLAWTAERGVEPPTGRYRVIEARSYGSSFQEFEIYERREREIRRIEQDDAYGQLRDDVDLLSRAATTPADSA